MLSSCLGLRGGCLVIDALKSSAICRGYAIGASRSKTSEAVCYGIKSIFCTKYDNSAWSLIVSIVLH